MRTLLFITVILFSNFLFSQKKIFDENDKMITLDEFNHRKNKLGGLKIVYNDSLDTAKITSDTEKGEVDSEKLITDLAHLLKLKISPTQPTIIIFYPGKDPCNSSGLSTPKSSFLDFKENEKKANKIKQSNILYLYKSKEGIKTINKIKWYKDPKNIIENTFFHYHYPCSSYVIIYNNKYISHFGEFPLSSILNNLKTIIQ
ncbi:hypothetical protein [Chryseobacterium potabilaquae]|uniref:Uncharacterized protein n=1 Tax=Chryseobacterium potabilaquae TaxID=2675057 RepID=A0A6N4X998_9FLAO|nr:hypothetical protein [Chryseobacterium potabilaquae]CAA7196275.1 hypothetical protein CHRY9293_02382 [Chryseobacterium potabilaquae]